MREWGKNWGKRIILLCTNNFDAHPLHILSFPLPCMLLQLPNLPIFFLFSLFWKENSTYWEDVQSNNKNLRISVSCLWHCSQRAESRNFLFQKMRNRIVICNIIIYVFCFSLINFLLFRMQWIWSENGVAVMAGIVDYTSY